VAPRRQLFLVPPHGARVRTIRVRGAVVFFLALLVAGGFAGYFIPFSRFSLDKFKLNERNNLRNINHDLLRRYIGIRFALDTLRAQSAELYPRHAEVATAVVGATPRKPGATAIGANMGISQLHELVQGYEHKWRQYVSRIDSAHDYFDNVPVVNPVQGRSVLSSPFGLRPDPFAGQVRMHNGVDFVAPKGQPVIATANGTVLDVRNDEKRWGNVVRIRHARGFMTVYAHLGSVAVQRGKSVKRGDIIGTLGASGLTTGPHLHYEVHVNGEPIDPTRLFFPASHGMLFDTIAVPVSTTL
jgi:murein DD-endopeptidase MepM/ murein hydrolase activator NlpD